MRLDVVGVECRVKQRWLGGKVPPTGSSLRWLTVLFGRRSHRIDHPAHDPCVLANLPAAGESALLEEFDGRAEQKPARRLPAGGHLGDGLDEAAAGMGDLVQRAF